MNNKTTPESLMSQVNDINESKKLSKIYAGTGKDTVADAKSSMAELKIKVLDTIKDGSDYFIIVSQSDAAKAIKEYGIKDDVSNYKPK